jgi:hypothetical protein
MKDNYSGLLVDVSDLPEATHSIRQMSMPKPVRARTWRPPLPSARRWPRRRRSSTPGCSSWTRNHPQPAAVLPESAARKVSALVWRAHIPDTYAASGPESATWKDPDPRRRSSRGSGAQNRPACPAMAATRRLRPVLLNDFLALWSQALAFLAVTHRYKRTHCLWLEQFQIARTISDPCRIFLPGRDSALVSGRAHISQIWITRFLASRH